METMCIKRLKEVGCLKTGKFTLKSGISVDFYIDLRESSMYTDLFDTLVKLVKSNIPVSDEPLAIIGVPYGVWPLAASVARDLKLPYYPVRKEVKEYGVKPDSRSYSEFNYVLIEDVISSGSSLIETLQKLDGKRVTDIIVIVDRELGGKAKLARDYPKIRVHTILKASDLISKI